MEFSLVWCMAFRHAWDWSDGAMFPYTEFFEAGLLALRSKGSAFYKESVLLPSSDEAPQLDPKCWVDEHGDCLYRFALLRVRKPEVAEDLVQDTLLAAVKAAGNFTGRSSERSWLVGILKHKIADHFRKHGRETPFTDMEFLSDEMSHKFEAGFWNHDIGPKDWQEDEAVTFSGEFWQTMRDCMKKLPPRVANAFMMREMDDAETPEICETLGISQSNLWVMLHRARMALRECLEVNWFGRA